MAHSSPGHETGASGILIKPQKRKRQGKPKTKTGCITCKIRRIKCDEGKPECMKCKSTGRRCDGYAPPTTIITSTTMSNATHRGTFNTATMTSTSEMVLSLQIPKNPFLDFPGTEIEHRYLDFFHSETAPILSGIFDSRFWNALLPQIGRSEPTIRHAMMSLASMHEHIEAKGSSITNSGLDHQFCGKSQQFSIVQYNKAIHHLNQRLLEGCHSEEVVLTCCILFIYLEFLRGNIDTAISHLKSGIAILINWRTNSPSASTTLNFLSEPQSIADNLEQIFSRLTIQAFLCGHPSFYLHPEDSQPQTPLSIPKMFNTLHEAKSSMDHLSKLALRFLRLATPFKYDDVHSPTYESLAQFRDTFQIKFEQWSGAFESMLAQPTFQMNSQEATAATILRILYHIAKIWMGISLAIEETATDEYIDEFTSIVNLGSSLEDRASHPTDSKKADIIKTPPRFTFEMGVIPPLFFAAIKCRDPVLRRRAVSLLSTTVPRREGLWDADWMQAIAERLIFIEEKDIDPAKVSSCDSNLARLLPEEKRVYEAAIHHRLSNSGPLSEGKRVTFMMKPHGLKGHWDVWEEEATWRNGKAHWKKCDYTMPLHKDGRDLWAVKENEKGVWSDRPASETVASMLGYDDLDQLGDIIRSWNNWLLGFPVATTSMHTL